MTDNPIVPSKIVPAKDEIARHIMAVFDQFNETQAQDVFTKAAICYAFLDGLQDPLYLSEQNPDQSFLHKISNMETEGGFLYFNKMKDYYMQWASLCKAGIPIYSCEAGDSYNPQSKETARIRNVAFKYHDKYVWNFATTTFSRLLFDIFCGGQAYKFYYPGKPNNRMAPGKQPKTVVKDLTLPVFPVAWEGGVQTSLSEAALVVVQQVASEKMICEMFPGKEKEISDWLAANPTEDNVSLTRANQYLSMAGISLTERTTKSLDPSDKEKIFYIGFKSPSKLWPKGKKWLITNEQMVCEAELDGGVIPIELIITAEHVPGCRLITPAAWAGLSAQAGWNDLCNNLLKMAARQSDPAIYKYEDSIVSPANPKNTDNNIILKPGHQYTLRPNPALIAQGVGPKDQVPFSPSPDSPGMSINMLSAVDNMFAGLLHINSDLGQQVPSGTPAELLKTQYSIVKEKLSQVQLLLEDSISRAWMIASTLMQAVLVPGDIFTLTDASIASSVTWKEENMAEGVNHVFHSQINEPTTIEGKLQAYQAVANVFGPKVFENLDKEDIIRIVDQVGQKIAGTINPETEEAEDVNLRIQNNEIEASGKTEYSGVELTQWSVKGFKPLMEHNKLLRLKVHSDMKTGKIWQSLTADQQSALDGLCREYIALMWIEQNKQGGMFGMLPRAKFDAMMWQAMGVEISPEDQQAMSASGMTYRELQEVKMQQEVMAQQTEPSKTNNGEALPVPEAPGLQVGLTTDLNAN